MPRVTEAHLEQRRQQILDAAITCFAWKGFHQTTMADIAAQAGVSDTLAYRYFSGKDELIEAAVKRHGDSTVDGLLGAPDGIEDFRALVDLLIGTNTRRFEQPEAVKSRMGMHLRAWAEALHDEKVRNQIVERWRHYFDVTEGLVRRAQEAEQIAPDFDPRAVAWVMIATHYGSTLLAVLDPEIDIEKSRDVMLALVFGDLPAHSNTGDRTNVEEEGG